MVRIAVVSALIVLLAGCYDARTPAYCAPDGEPRGDLCPSDGGLVPCSSGDGGWYHPCEEQ